MRQWTVFAGILMLSACAQQPVRNKQVPSPPDGVQPSQLLVWVKGPVDTDANAYGDTMQITAQMYSEDYQFASIAVPGAFHFSLKGRDGKLISEWTIGPEQSAAAIRRGGPGPVYILELNMLNAGGDKVAAQSAELAASFVSAAGTTVRAASTTVRLGRQAY